MDGLKDRLTTLHWFGAKLLKPVRRRLTGTGRMMATFQAIRAATQRGDLESVRAISTALQDSYPDLWSRQYTKHDQLVALCRLILAKDPTEKTYAYYALLPLLEDETHELTREIVLLLFGKL